MDVANDAPDFHAGHARIKCFPLATIANILRVSTTEITPTHDDDDEQSLYYCLYDGNLLLPSLIKHRQITRFRLKRFHESIKLGE